MPPKPPENSGPFPSFRSNFNLALFIARVWATSLEVFLRRDFGARYLGIQAAAVIILVPLYSLAWRDYDTRALAYFIPVYLLRCLYIRVRIALKRSSDYGHSYYNGWPCVLGPKAKLSERAAKRVFEPCFTLALGWTIRYLGEAPLGTYLMIGAACLLFSFSVCEAAERARVMSLHDALIEQEFTAERFRQMRGDF